MQKVLKKIVSILFTLVLISSIGIVSSFAYQVPQNSETAVLKGNEHYSCSGKVIGTFKLFGATTLIISKKPGNTGISRDIRTEFTTDLLLSD